MREIALTLNLPGYSSAVSTPTGFTFNTAGDVVSSIITLALYIAGVLLISWLVWGIFQYIFAGGSKENLAHARKRIIFAIFGFILVVLAFTIQKYFADLLIPNLQNNQVQSITQPS